MHYENEIYLRIMSLLISIFLLSRGFVLGPQSILHPVVQSGLDNLDVDRMYSDGAESQSDYEDMDTTGPSPSSTGIMHIGHRAGMWFFLLSPWDLLNNLHRTGGSWERDPRLSRIKAIPSSRRNIYKEDLDHNQSEVQQCSHFSRSFTTFTIHQIGKGSSPLHPRPMLISCTWS